MTAFFIGLWAKAKAWCYGIAAVILIVLSAWYLGKRKGKGGAEAAAHDAAVAHDAQQQAATARQTASHIQTKEQVHDQVQAMPAPANDPARVGDAADGTAAAELRKSWLRQEAKPAAK